MRYRPPEMNKFYWSLGATAGTGGNVYHLRYVSANRYFYTRLPLLTASVDPARFSNFEWTKLRLRLFELWKSQNVFSYDMANTFLNFEQNINTWETKVKDVVNSMRYMT